MATRKSAAYIAAKYNDQNSLEILRHFWREERVSPLDNRGDTILHFLSIHGNENALRYLVKEITSEDLKVKNSSGDTPLHEAARFGRKEMLKIMLRLDEELICIKNKLGETPLFVAASSGKTETFNFLANNNFCDEFTMTRDVDGSTVLHAAITEQCYYFALELLKLYPKLASKTDKSGATALNILATENSSFRSGSLYTVERLGTTPFVPMQAFEILMYFCIPSMYEESKPNNNLEDPKTSADILLRKERSSFINFILGNGWLGAIDEEKQKHILATILARRLIEEEEWINFYEKCEQNPLIQAAEHGTNEIVVEIIKNCPQAIETMDEDGKNMFHIAAEKKNRFLFDYLLKKCGHNDRMLLDRDSKENTIMHYAASVASPFGKSTGELASPFEKSGREPASPSKKSVGEPASSSEKSGGKPATPSEKSVGEPASPSEKSIGELDEMGGLKALMLMGWGVLWFKRVKYCVHPRLWTVKNQEGITAHDLFELKHSNLRKVAETTVRELANSVLVLSALLFTVNFAVVFTIPGGFDSKTGIPILLTQRKSELWMLMFFVGAALYDSVFTMGSLLSILLSKFDFDDFYIALPMKYNTAIISIYYATTFTVLGCVQALNVENVFMNKDTWWIIVSLLFFGCAITVMITDICYLSFDYVYHFLSYSFSYKRLYM